MQRIIIIVLIVFVVLAFMMTYTVRFTETAVITTFGAASQTPITEPGLKFTLPYVQSITKYDRRLRYLESKPETQQTADASQIVVTSFVAWSVSDPNVFHKAFSAAGDRSAAHYRAAERIIGEKLRAAMGEVSKFRFNELLSGELVRPPDAVLLRVGIDPAAFNDEQRRPALDWCEALIRTALGGSALEPQAEGAASVRQYGITVASVGIIGVELPEENTRVVFERMKTSRANIANKAVSEGKAIAETIRGTAQADADKIMAFAQRRADMIRGEGERESSQFIARLSSNPELAIFLKQMDFMRGSFGRQTTLVIPAGMNGWRGFELFRPDAMDGALSPDGIPGFSAGALPPPPLAPADGALHP